MSRLPPARRPDLERLPPRPQQPDPDPRRLRLFAVEERIADARRALQRARQLAEAPLRGEIVALEDLVQRLGLEVLKEANGE